MKFKRLVLLFSLMVFGTQVYANIEGEWALYCDSSTNIYNDESGQSKISVLTSQIYIKVDYKEVSEKKSVQIFFKGVSDLGSGGMRLNIPWANLSKEKPIGLFQFISPKESILDWYGFVDNEGNKIDVMSDFSTDEVNILDRCR